MTGHATISAMTTRRDHRQTHVRPRPPSTGRPAPVKAKPRAPGPIRLSGHQPIRRRRGVPRIIGIALVAAVLALSGGVLVFAASGFGIAVGGIGSTLTGFVAGVTSTPVPKATLAAIGDPPSLAQPAEPYTAEATVDLVVTVPASLAGDPNHRIRVYLTLPDQTPTAIQETPLAATAKTIIPVRLEKGINDFMVSIVGPSGESDTSAVVRYVLDDVKPKVTITSPKNNVVVNGPAVVVIGKTQARTTLLARNDASGSSVAATTGSDGTFKLSLALSPGVNDIAITATDPAGNITETSLSVRRGTGKLEVKLTTSTSRIRRSSLPEPVTLRAKVTDPDGLPLAGANITFVLTPHGVGPVSINLRTSPDGTVSWTTMVSNSADIGDGLAVVMVSTSEFGPATDRKVIRIVK